MSKYTETVLDNVLSVWKNPHTAKKSALHLTSNRDSQRTAIPRTPYAERRCVYTFRCSPRAFSEDYVAHSTIGARCTLKTSSGYTFKSSCYSERKYSHYTRKSALPVHLRNSRCAEFFLVQVHSNSLYRLWFGTKSSHLSINMSMCTKIVFKNVFSGSKNPQVQSKPCYKLWFATISSSGHKRVEGYRNTPKNMLSRSRKLPGTLKFALQAMTCDEIVSWASTCRGTLRQS